MRVNFRIFSTILSLLLLSQTFGFSQDATSKVIAPASQIAAGHINSTAVTPADAVEVFKFTISDLASGDGLPTKVTNFCIQKGGGTADWTDNIAGAELWFGGSKIPDLTLAISDTELNFENKISSFDVADGTNAEITLKIYLNKKNITDNATFIFEIPNTSHNFVADASGSQFTADFGNSTSVKSNTFTIWVTATQLMFSSQLDDIVWVNFTPNPEPVVYGTDIYGNLDVDYSGSITLSNSGGLSMTNNTESASGGIADFTSFTFTTGNQYVTLSATDGTLNSIAPSRSIAVAVTGCEIYSEDFESYTEGELPNGGWSEYTITDGEDRWGITSTLPLSGSRSLSVRNNTAYQQYNKSDDVEKIAYSPLIDARGYKFLELSFKWKCDADGNYDYGRVVWSTDGVNWQNVDSYVHYLRGYSSTQTYNRVNLSVGDNKQFYLGFRWINDGDGSGSNPPLVIDDITITGIPLFDYAFSFYEDEFQPITGTVVSLDANDAANINLPTDFDFKYLGNTVTAVRASLNGWLEAGTTHTGDKAENNALISSSTVNFIAPLWDNLIADAQTRIIYRVTGTKPTRVFTVEWRDVLWGGARQNFQVKLHETSYAIEFHYGNMNEPIGGSASIGINGPGTCLNKMIAVTPGSTPKISDKVEEPGVNSVEYLNNGLVYIFFPQIIQNIESWQQAEICVGQASFTSYTNSVSRSTAIAAVSSAISSKGVLAVGEQQNKADLSQDYIGRVLIWDSVPTSDGTPADAVIGKTDFTSITEGCTAVLMKSVESVAFTPDGNRLLVADGLNNRVLIWDSIPTGAGQPADVVIGQTDFTSNSSGCSATKFNHPNGIIVLPDGRLLINDGYNNRVLIYNSVPTTNGAAADVVIGQTDFTSNSGGLSADKINETWYCAYSPDGKLLLGDTENNRILEFDDVPTQNGASADIVIGQYNFTSNSSGVYQFRFDRPVDIAVSPEGKMAFASFDNHRVIIFDAIPTTNGGKANVVLGQPNFRENVIFNNGIDLIDHTTSPNDKNMYQPYGVDYDLYGRLFVSGRNMHRVMIYGNVPTEVADLEISITSDAPNPACIGGLVTYTVTITNHGSSDALNVVATAQLPYGFIYDSHTTTSGSYNKKSGYWRLPIIKSGETETLKFSGFIPASFAGHSPIIAYANILYSDKKDNVMNNNGDNDTLSVGTNSSPTIEPIPDQYIARGSHSIPLIDVIVDDADGISDIVSYTATSSDTTLIPVDYTNHIIFGGTAPNKTLDLIPVPTEYGIDTMSVIVTDASGCFAEEQFIVYVGNIWEGDDLSNPTDWHTAENWTSAVPNCSLEAYIPSYPKGGFFPVIQANANCEDLYEESRASVTLNNGVSLDICGNLILKSDSLSTASFVDLNNSAGNVTIADSAIVERYLRHGGWHYVSAFSPNISNKTFTEYNSPSYNGNILAYDQAYTGDNDGDGDIDWMDGWQWLWLYNHNDDPLEVMRGYAVYWDSTCNNIVQMIDTNGNLNTGTMQIQVANEDKDALGVGEYAGYYARGWNLIGNPYPSGINVNDFLNLNAVTNGVIDGTVYFWGRLGNTNLVPEDYASINLAGATNIGSTGVVPDIYISTGQAFMVRKSDNGTANVEFNNSMREQENSYFYKNKTENLWRLYLVLENENYSINDILIAFKEGATDSVDIGYDALKVQGNPDLAFFSLIDDMRYTIQTLPKKFSTKDVKLGFYAGSTGNYSISLMNLEYFPKNMVILLEDKLNDTLINIRETEKYEFNIAEKGFCESRFVLHFINNKAPEIISTIENQTIYEDEFFRLKIGKNIFSDDEELRFSAEQTNGKPLPAWLNFDEKTMQFYGTPENFDVGELNVKLIATDTYGAKNQTSFAIKIINTNDAPFVFYTIPEIIVNSNEAFSYNIDNQTIIDIDIDDYLQYEILNAPVWLNFDEESLTISGIPQYGEYNLTFKGTDKYGESASTNFKLLVNATNESDISEYKIKIYPNPVVDDIKINSSEFIKTVSITDISGKIIKSFTVNKFDFEINLSDLPAGKYQIVIQTQKEVFIKNLIKL